MPIPAFHLAYLCIALAVPAGIALALFTGWFFLAALWDILLIGGLLLVAWKVVRFLHRETGSRKPAYVVLAVLAVVALVAGYDTRYVRKNTGIHLATPIYDATGLAFGDFSDRLFDEFRNEYGRGDRCAKIEAGTIQVDKFGREHCDYHFPDGVDTKALAALGKAIDEGASLSMIQSALETLKKQPHFGWEGISPANWSSFSEWYRGEAGASCTWGARDVSVRNALVYCFGTRQAYADEYCDIHRDRADDYRLVRQMCGGRRQERLTGADLDALAFEESRHCSEGRCSGWVISDKDLDEPTNWVEWLEKRAGWDK